MSNNVGHLKLQAFERNDVEFIGHGKLSMLATSFPFAVTEFVSNNPDAPVMVMHAKTGDGRLVEIGKGWKKLMKKGAHEGQPFFSLTFDDPSLEKPINVTAFPTEERGVFDIVWQRPKKAASGLGAMAAPASADLDDEIPF